VYNDSGGTEAGGVCTVGRVEGGKTEGEEWGDGGGQGARAPAHAHSPQSSELVGSGEGGGL